MISLAGLICRLIMTRKSSAESRRRRQKIQGDSDVLLVIGIGGSYLGARAAIEFLSHSFYNMLPKSRQKNSGNLFCRQQHQQQIYHVIFMDVLEGKDFSINIISKSGTTTEPAIAFRVFKEMLDDQIWKRRGEQENLCDDG